MTRFLRTWLNRRLGDAGERASARFLRRKGMRILTRGYRTPLGEIDLIARDGKTVVFVEVKTRRKGTPAEAVTLEKQRRLTRAALHFLQRYKLLECSARFDVVAVVWPDDKTPPTIEHYVGAFDPPDRFQFFT